MTTHVIDNELLYIWVDRKRRDLRLRWTEVADQTGIPKSSLSRWTHGSPISADATGSLIVWGGGPADIFIRRRLTERPRARPATP